MKNFEKAGGETSETGREDLVGEKRNAGSKWDDLANVEFRAKESHATKDIGKLVLVMDRTLGDEVDTPEKTKRMFDELEFSTFKRYLDFANGILRDIPSRYRGQMSPDVKIGEHKGELIYLPPDEHDKLDLLRETFEKAQQVDDTQMAALTLGFGINLTHYYGDGNGRLGRLVFNMLNEGFSLKDGRGIEFATKLAERSGLNPNPQEFEFGNCILVGKMLKPLRQEKGFDEMIGDADILFMPVDKRILDEMPEDEQLIFGDYYNFGLNIGQKMSIMSLGAERIKSINPERRVGEDEMGRCYVVDTTKLVESLSDDEMKAIKDSNREIRREYVRNVVNFTDEEVLVKIARGAYFEKDKIGKTSWSAARRRKLNQALNETLWADMEAYSGCVSMKKRERWRGGHYEESLQRLLASEN